jgi:uncharacterized protein (DUF1778 family)
MTETKKTLDQRTGPAGEAQMPASLVLDDQAFDRLVELLERPPAPTRALRELMSGSRGRSSSER